MKKLVIALILFKLVGSIVLSGFAVVHETINKDNLYDFDKEYNVIELSESEDLLPEYDYSY